jgi:hypothetical protein
MTISIRTLIVATIFCGLLAAMAPIDAAWSQGGSESNNNWGSVSFGTSGGQPTMTIGGITLNVDKSTQKIYDAVVRGENPNEIKKMVLAAEAEQKASRNANQNANKQITIKENTNKENTNMIKSNTNKQNTNAQKGNPAGGSSNVTAVKTKILTATGNTALLKPKK